MFWIINKLSQVSETVVNIAFIAVFVIVAVIIGKAIYEKAYIRKIHRNGGF